MPLVGVGSAMGSWKEEALLEPELVEQRRQDSLSGQPNGVRSMENLTGREEFIEKGRVWREGLWRTSVPGEET